MSNRLVVGVVEPVFFQRAGFKAANHLVAIVDRAQTNQFHHFDVLVEHLRLMNISRDTIQDEDRAGGVEGPRVNELIDVLPPETHREIVGNQLPLARVLQEDLPNLTAKINRAKDVAASEVVEAGQYAEQFALSALAAAGGSKQENRFDLFHVARLPL